MTTNQLRLPALRGGLPRLPDGAAALAIGIPAAAALGAAAALHPDWWRYLLATALAVNGIVVAMKWPRAATVATLLWLPFLALVRRLLIAEAGWTSQDPLLLVGPLVALFLCYRLFVVEKRELARDRVSKLVLALLVIALFGAFNPFGEGGLLGGLGGLIFLGVPLLWFFIGRELGTRDTVRWVMYAVIGMSLAIGAYGLYQTEFASHLPQWDADWFQITGFDGAKAGVDAAGIITYRPWGTFSSPGEYANYLGTALAFAIALLYHRRPVAAIAIPALAIALFQSGGRSSMAYALFTAVVLTALRTRNRVLALVVVVLGVGVIYGAALTFGPSLDRIAGVSGSTTAKRQTGGLLNPLDPKKSTFLLHLDSLGNGVADGFRNPVGSGTGSTNLGARLTGGSDRETDVDIADAFVSWGFVGGLIFVAIIVLSFKEVFSRYLRRPPDPLLLGVVGALIVNLGQWLQGGHYAAAPLTFFMLGFAMRPSERSQDEPEQARGSSRIRWGPWGRSARSNSLPKATLGDAS